MNPIGSGETSMKRKATNRKKIIILVALCLILTVAAAGSIVYSTSILSDKNQQICSLQDEVAPLNAQIDSLNATIQQQNEVIAQKNEALDTLNNRIIDLNSQLANLTDQVSALTAQIDRANNQVTSQSNIILSDITVTDERINATSGILHISCQVTNNGTNNAFDALLKVSAISAGGIVIDEYYPLGGLTGGMTRFPDFSINYTGSPVISWMIRPIWTNLLALPYTGTLS
jgi:peptidoglycan hydrolase CwlO-like protein